MKRLSSIRWIRDYKEKARLRKLHDTLVNSDSLQEMRDAITEVVLNNVGLTIAKDGKLEVGNDINLSLEQQRVIKLVAEYEYRAALL